MSNELRKQEAAQELVICANQAHTQIETSLDALKARWSALREHYHGLGAEDTEAEINLLLAQSDSLLSKLQAWRDLSQSQLQESEEEATCNLGG
ncbi:hypothetical protein [Vibrio rhodolitus]|uniref:hypothetical protein n=1 Tax=Vibrio rhodolitus TaxID=2231649 RepID=UPI000E0A0E6A|nr:hypothetical protein [Vibrio rhodolitus]